MRGYRGENGQFTYNYRDGFSDQPVDLPCGICLSCRINHSYEWGQRGYHEASLHSENIFFTATYSPENLPNYGSLHRPHIQDFIRKLRRSMAPQRIRILYSGEYGDVTLRAHYHGCLFNYRPTDCELIREKGDQKYYKSTALTALWGLGDISFSDVTLTSAAYVMAYTLKKQYGDTNAYQTSDLETGELISITPPFSGQSRRPGIGIPWLQTYLNDTYPRDQIVINGKPMRPCRAYDEFIKRNHESLWRTVRAARKKLHPVSTLLTNPRRPIGHNAKTETTYTTSDRSRLSRSKILAKRQSKRNEIK